MGESMKADDKDDNEVSQSPKPVEQQKKNAVVKEQESSSGAWNGGKEQESTRADDEDDNEVSQTTKASGDEAESTKKKEHISIKANDTKQSSDKHVGDAREHPRWRRCGRQF